MIDLIKGNKKSKGEPKANIFLTILAALLDWQWVMPSPYNVEGVAVIACNATGYYCCTIGTYLFFTQLSVYFIRKIKREREFVLAENKYDLILRLVIPNEG